MKRLLTSWLVFLTTAAASAQSPPESAAAIDRVEVVGIAPVPDVGEGAPLFTTNDVKAIEQEAQKVATNARADVRQCRPHDRSHQACDLDSDLSGLLACEAEYADRTANLASKAARATEAAESSRVAAARGELNMSAVEAAELVRQEAVQKMQAMREKLLEAQAIIGAYQDAASGQGGGLSPMQVAVQRRMGNVGLGLATPASYDNLAIRNVSAREVTDRKGARIILLRAELVNSGPKAENIPPMQATLLDEKGWVLANTTLSATGKKQVAAGEAKAFQMEIKAAPEQVYRAVVTFASSNAPKPRLSVGRFCPRDLPRVPR